jgi:phage terminase large subunit-like protein
VEKSGKFDAKFRHLLQCMKKFEARMIDIDTARQRIAAALSASRKVASDIGGPASQKAEDSEIEASLPAASDEALRSDDDPIAAISGFPALHTDWDIIGRPDQKPPPGDWHTWLILGGRGSGKTRAGAEWVHALGSAGDRSNVRIALVAETLGDAREVMIDGMSGIARIARVKRPDFEISRRRLVWPNGAIAQIFSSEDPESLRGPQFHYAWCDELAKWKYGQETWDMLQFGLRLGTAPRQLVTTTPRPVPLVKNLLADPGTGLTRLSTRSNAGNLAPGFIHALSARYGGTRLGRQELDGELIEDREDALWKRDAIAAITLRSIGGALRRIVVAVDPPAGAGIGSCCGIVVAGLDTSGRAVVLADCSVEGASPATWATAVVKAYRRFDADRVVAEINQGGDMVTAMLRSIDANLSVSTVRATRGKYLRAEPVAALYEQGKVAHAGRFSALEDQMYDFGPDGLSSGRSPDRLDALVWALTALMLEGGGEPRVRGI